MKFPLKGVTPKWTAEKTNDCDVDPQARLIQLLCFKLVSFFFFVLTFALFQDGQAEASVSVAIALCLLRDKKQRSYTPRQFRGLVRLEKNGEEAGEFAKSGVKTIYYRNCFGASGITRQITGDRAQLQIVHGAG